MYNSLFFEPSPMNTGDEAEKYHAPQAAGSYSNVMRYITILNHLRLNGTLECYCQTIRRNNVLNTDDDNDGFPQGHNIVRVQYEGDSDEDSDTDIEFDDQEELDYWFGSNYKNYEEKNKNNEKYSEKNNTEILTRTCKDKSFFVDANISTTTSNRLLLGVR